MWLLLAAQVISGSGDLKGALYASSEPKTPSFLNPKPYTLNPQPISVQVGVYPHHSALAAWSSDNAVFFLSIEWRLGILLGVMRVWFV